MDLTVAEDIKKSGKNTKNCTKKGLDDPDNQDGIGHSPRARHPRV